MIRPVRAADVKAIAALHVRAWQHGYAHFVAPDRMPTVERREAMWRDLVPGQAWLAERDGAVAGVVGITPGEVKVLYVDPDHQGHGLGSMLLAHAERQLRAAGHTGATLWAFRDNADGRGFYERRGWVADGAEQELWDGVSEVRYRRSL